MLPPLQLATFIFATVSVAIYTAIFITIQILQKHEPYLRGSFFRLCASNYIADVIFYTEFTLLMRFRKYGLLNEFFSAHAPLLDIVPPISQGLHYYIKLVVYIGEVAIAANRLTAAVRPLIFERIWNTKLIWAVRGVQFLAPLAVMVPVTMNPGYEFQYVIYPNQSTLRLETDPVSTEVYAYIDLLSSTTATVSSLIMYICTILMIRRLMRERCISRSTAKSSSVDNRLLLSALMLFLVLTPNTFLQVLTIVFKNKLNSVMFIHDLSYPVIDLMYSCPPWALLLTSSKLRRSLWRCCGGRVSQKFSSKATTPVLTMMADTRRTPSALVAMASQQ